MNTPTLTTSFTTTSSPSSVTDVGGDDAIKLCDVGLAYVHDTFVSEDDPYFVIHWNLDGVMDALFAVHGQQLANIPNPPAFLDTSSPDNFKESVHQFLRTFGGGSFGNVIGPNTIAQFSNISTILTNIELHPHFQMLANHLGRALAICGEIKDRPGSITRLYRPAPFPPQRIVFE